ncbi:hypothetical protein N0M98_27700 [Paenibacillus doosanensis]|uniref:hypothetical protein n=1 Tax=Paenibacillus doosanensis TaxID=1229154 RepID=UPI0021805C19|nr:hypothetical protein [Paenibacillus doosanensis]MCS7463897.1 hypothetical protein [Paenibacillus doosanensis]
MSIQLLQELHSEVRRLFIAGSALAAGDVRLDKLRPRLEALGEHAPVFHRLARLVEQLTEASGDEAPPKLLELGTLLHAVMYTQGKTDAAGEAVPIRTADTSCYTGVSYRKLRAATEALTQKDPGRLEAIRTAYEEGVFRDIRTIVPAVSALDETNSEIAEYVTEYVVPALGEQALPVLKSQFDVQAGKGAVRRLQHIHRIAGMKEKTLYLQAMTEGSLEVRAAAIKLLGAYPECEAVLLGQSLDKKKEIRRAAYFALAELASGAAADRLYQAFLGKDRDNAIDPIQSCESESLTERLVSFAEAQLPSLAQAEAAEQAIAALESAAQCMDGKTHPQIADLWMRLLSEPAFAVKEADTLQREAARQLLAMGLPGTDRFLLALSEQRDRKWIAHSFQAAVRTLPPGEVYDRFAQAFKAKGKQQAAAKELLHAFYTLTEPAGWRAAGEAASYGTAYDGAASLGGAERALPAGPEWDSRWVHLFADINEEELVCRLASEPDDKVTSYLLKRWETAPQLMKPRTVSILGALLRQRCKDAPELIMRTFELTKAKQIYYLDDEKLALLAALPAAYAERVAQFAEALPYESLKQQVRELAERIKSQENKAVTY